MATILSNSTKDVFRYENRDGEVLSYREFGDSEDCVILIHGWMTSGIVFDSLLAQASLSNYRIIIPNLRGSGIDSLNSGEFTIIQYGKDIIDLVNHLGLEKFHLTGHCMGGQIAQWLASELPTRVVSLALICSIPASGLTFPEDLAEAYRNSGENSEVQGLILEQLSPRLTISEHNRLLNEAGRLSRASVANSFDAWSDADFEDQLYRILSPTLVLATDNPTLPEDLQRRAVAGSIRHSRFVKLEGCGHYPQCEKPFELGRQLKTFWTQSTPIPFQLPR
jgi:non-heme chloroperoxidase